MCYPMYIDKMSNKSFYGFFLFPILCCFVPLSRRSLCLLLPLSVTLCALNSPASLLLLPALLLLSWTVNRDTTSIRSQVSPLLLSFHVKRDNGRCLFFWSNTIEQLRSGPLVDWAQTSPLPPFTRRTNQQLPCWQPHFLKTESSAFTSMLLFSHKLSQLHTR